jgi:sulfotransferase family protein
MAQSNLNYLFITGMGRSGTTFLAGLLASINNVSAHHEYIGNREYWLLSWYMDGGPYKIPFLEYQKQKIDAMCKNKKWFIDVNSYLQYSSPELEQVFSTKNILHLVRDPKEVIRSIYIRRNDNDIHLIPKQEDDVRKWLTEDRFYRVCWNWKSAMSLLLQQKVPIIKFESLISDFDYLRKHLLDKYDLPLSETEWEKATETKANKTKSKAYRYLYAKVKGKQFQHDTLGDYIEWPDEYKQVFDEMCGSLSIELGYK